jgi:hypothetical protein
MLFGSGGLSVAAGATTKGHDADSRHVLLISVDGLQRPI